MLTTVKTLADVRQVLRGYASPHPPEAEDYYDRRLAERAAAKAKEEKEPIAQEAREAERATARHAVAGPNKPRGTKNSSAAYERRERLDDALLDFSPESKSARTSTWPGQSANAGRDAAGGAQRAHQGTAAQLSVSVFMQDKC